MADANPAPKSSSAFRNLTYTLGRRAPRRIAQVVASGRAIRALTATTKAK